MPPRITIWVTDRAISRRVAMALKVGLGHDAVPAFAAQATAEQIAQTPVHIGYGILDGMEGVARLAEDAGKNWFIVDLGYFGPGHFDGNYRIAHRGTQSRFDAKIQSAEAVDCAPWKTGGEVALLCPPTAHVCKFFSINESEWIEEATQFAGNLGLPAKLRRKGDAEDLDAALDSAVCVITFNSAVGWRALEKGIPAFSHVKHSTVGSWHGGAKTLQELKQLSRESLFRFMRASQLSLLEIQHGKIYNVLARYVPEIIPDGR
ncbi:MAG TPA: hypothetical protein VHB73_02345 [Alphaproteobacteria bacterium]|nr:hypothetical protein [Alphaproteobacteria bacterium]